MRGALRRRLWLLAALFVALVSAGALAWWTLFLSGQDRAAADNWSSIASAPAAFASLLLGVLAIMVRQGLRSGRTDEPSPVEALRDLVRVAWAAEVVSQQVFLPRPLRLRWRSATAPGVQAGIAAPSDSGDGAVSGSLGPEPDLGRQAAWQLVRAFEDGGLRQLVVLGEAGAGKSTLAHLFVVASVADAGADSAVAVLLPIAAWVPAESDGRGLGDTIEEWIAARIRDDHPQITPDQADWLVRHHQVIAVLDGLDELPVPLQGRALGHLERAAAAGLRMVVTCRSQEYAAIVAAVGVLPQAVIVEVEPVSLDDAVAYLTEREAVGSSRWQALTATMTADPGGALAQALSTPLMISLTRQVYQRPGTDPGELAALSTGNEIHQRILGRFLPAVYGDRSPVVARWLAHLVPRLQAFPRDPHLAWWRLAKSLPKPLLAILVAVQMLVLSMLLCFGIDAAFTATPEPGSALLAGAVYGTLLGLVAGLQTARAVHAQDEPPRRLPRLRAGLRAVRDVYFVAGALSVISALVLLVGLWLDEDYARQASISIAYLLSGPGHVDRDVVLSILLTVIGVITVLMTASWLGGGQPGIPHRTAPRLRSLPRQLAAGLGIGLLLGLPWAAAGELTAAGVINVFEADVGRGVAAGAAVYVGILVGLVRWLRAPVPPQELLTPDAALRSDRTALLLATVGGAATAALITAAMYRIYGGSWSHPAACLLVGAASGLLVFYGSGSAWLAFTTARIWLAVCRRLPARLPRFLRHAHAAGVLRHAGAFYQVRHELIRAYLPVESRSARSDRSASRLRSALSAGAVRRWAPLIAGAVALSMLPVTAIGIDPRPGTGVLRLLVSGGTAAGLQSILRDADLATGVHVVVSELSTVGIAESVASGDIGRYDALLVASRHAFTPPSLAQAPSVSTARSPIVVGVRPAVAARLGWNAKTPTWSEIGAAMADGSLALGMSNPSTSLEGTLSLASVAAPAGGTAVTAQQELLRRLALGRGVAPSTRSLADRYFDPVGLPVDGLVGYESSLVTANLTHRDREQLALVYPADGSIVADFPLILLNPDSVVRRNYHALAAYLLRPATQVEAMSRTYRRPAVPGLTGLSWAADDGLLTTAAFPQPVVINDLLARFRAARLPANTIYVVDTSGSMNENGRLRSAVGALASVPFGSADRIVLLPFAGTVAQPRSFDLAQAGPSAVEAFRQELSRLVPRGNTATYDALTTAYDIAEALRAEAPDRTTSIVLITDGVPSTGRTFTQFRSSYQLRHLSGDIPTFTVYLGGPAPRELRDLAALTFGQTFDSPAGATAEVLSRIRGW
ncbi:hypothetical protein F4553_007646 [Allocatelliglobosispora scoriae]|uniref:VWFA domain-containing protein n=1 Tax=Allocatelliglobosispora scoriae TaxID=643052 RepID=A0A841C565_9ACTN|nr:substrate-binding domain-containing protein [Allocatelliglobosispora scoriae]MBB5874212.1 hypothetical protein [Allocatelliglobosispora scoriae]